VQIPLQQFEQYVDETILQRGLTYFKKGYVKQPEEITPGLYEANAILHIAILVPAVAKSKRPTQT
jgi:hypothetical protein